MEEATPWAELRRLAAAVEADAGKSGVRGGPEVDKEYVALARSREYVPDGESIYEIIESMGGKMVPHGSQGHPVYSGGNAMDRGSFYDHLTGNEDCVRKWQAKDGEELFPEGACLAALCHSLCECSSTPGRCNMSTAGLVTRLSCAQTARRASRPSSSRSSAAPRSSP